MSKNRYKTLATNTLIYSIGSFGSKILTFFLTRLYTEFMGPDQYSTANLILQTASLFVPIATLSIEEAVLRFVLDSKYKKEQIYSSGIAVAFLGNIAILILYPLLNLIPDLHGRMMLMYLCIFASGFRMVNQQFVRSRNLLKLYAVDGIFTTIMLFLFNVIFIALLKMNITGYILSVALSDICSSIFLMVMGRNTTFINFSSVTKKIVRTMLKYSIPLIPTYVLWWIVSASDLYMINYIVGRHVNGIYSAAYKIPTLISIVSTIFFQAWQFSAITEFNTEGSKKFYATVFDAYQSIMYIGSAGILLILIPLTKSGILLEEQFQSSYVYAPFLVIGVLMSCFCQFLSSIYSATKHTKNSMWTSLVAAIVNITLNIILIPLFGAQGASVSTMLSYSACFIIRIIDTRKLVHFKVDFFKIIMNTIALMIMCIVIVGDFNFTPFFLVAGTMAIILLNMNELVATIRKIFHKQEDL